MERNKTVILSYARTPFGSFLGKFSKLSASYIGAAAIKGALNRADISFSDIDEVIMGNVLSAGIGQAPARQAAIFAGLDKSTHCMTINKVCGSGMKAIMLADQSINLNQSNFIIAGGMESMSNSPHYLLNSRVGTKLGNIKQVDGMVHDGLWDTYNQVHMGIHGERCASKYNITREDQDEYAEMSYNRSQEAHNQNILANEICEVIDQKGNLIDSSDEEPFRVDFEKMKKLKSVFQKEGTITAANASTINDGAAVCLLSSEKKAHDAGYKAQARVLDYVQFSHDPEWFTTAPISAIKKLLDKNSLKIDDIDIFEINEAFSVVPIVAIKELGLNIEKVNVHGGAVSLGHPIGCSGARIVMSLINALKVRNKKLGVASICIGGGEATAMLIENIN
tara:strand:- start:86 stop:1264 length:1179 start_codon:yes stop_codon:yes gene_type:complete